MEAHREGLPMAVQPDRRLTAMVAGPGGAHDGGAHEGAGGSTYDVVPKHRAAAAAARRPAET
jgi:hypothetical protein